MSHFSIVGDVKGGTGVEKERVWRQPRKADSGTKRHRGLPVDRWTRRQTVIAYWGMALYFGNVLSQNAKGHIVGHVKNIGHDVRNPITRIYATTLAQPWHMDR